MRVVPKQRRTSVECELFSERFLCSRDTAEIKPRGARPAYSPASAEQEPRATTVCLRVGLQSSLRVVAASCVQDLAGLGCRPGRLSPGRLSPQRPVASPRA